MYAEIWPALTEVSVVTAHHAMLFLLKQNCQQLKVEHDPMFSGLTSYFPCPRSELM